MLAPADLLCICASPNSNPMNIYFASSGIGTLVRKLLSALDSRVFPFVDLVFKSIVFSPAGRVDLEFFHLFIIFFLFWFYSSLILVRKLEKHIFIPKFSRRKLVFDSYKSRTRACVVKNQLANMRIKKDFIYLMP